ncbi:MAG: cytochrome b/b6 domain-containing protein [Bauldia sp.]|nr:cytochrome b/b6 domain-containing protein [Bauldia sp.]
MSEAAMASPAPQKRKVYRHALVVRVTHWINALCIVFLVMSGLQIFNAHPHLYWGETSTFNQNDVPVDTVLSMGSRTVEGERQGVVRLFNEWTIVTTGFLGLSYANGEERRQGFPQWMTIPSTRDLATGRLWHFLFAWIFVINGFVYLLYGLGGRHFWRDLVPSRDQWRSFGRTVLDHLRFRFHRPGDSRYNIIQKLSYLVVIIALILIVMTGLSMSPGINAAAPWLPDLFGGRQSARTIHFICMLVIVLFTLVHIVLVLVSGVWNNIRSMITGRYVVREEAPHEPPSA